jgi:hypothetical protein
MVAAYWCVADNAPSNHRTNMVNPRNAPLHQILGRGISALMSDTSDQIVRKSVSLPSSLWALIDDYRFQKRIRSDADTIRRLIELGLEAATSAQTEKAEP